jgi:hypothetical protein
MSLCQLAKGDLIVGLSHALREPIGLARPPGIHGSVGDHFLRTQTICLIHYAADFGMSAKRGLSFVEVPKQLESDPSG